jgi:hypothetical protein
MNCACIHWNIYWSRLPLCNLNYTMTVFSQLSSEEYGQLKLALPRIAVLIGGADKNFDQQEQEWASKIAGIRTYSSHASLKDFYKEVKKEFASSLTGILATKSNQEELAAKLSALNHILAKLPVETGARLYHGFKRYAMEVAKASGGLFGFLTVNAAEAKWTDLPMLTPIHADVSEEEE